VHLLPAARADQILWVDEPPTHVLALVWVLMLASVVQRPAGGAHQVFSPATVRNWLKRTLERADLRDVDGTPIRFVPHDFRRLFATEVVDTGLPIHIAAAVLDHRVEHHPWLHRRLSRGSHPRSGSVRTRLTVSARPSVRCRRKLRGVRR